MNVVWQLPVHGAERTGNSYIPQQAKYHAFVNDRSLCGKYNQHTSNYDDGITVTSSFIAASPQHACQRCLDLWRGNIENSSCADNPRIEKGSCTKDVLMSAQPKWCRLIASEQKKYEIRKTVPREFFREYHEASGGRCGDFFEPFKVLLYCSQDKNDTFWYFDELFESEEKGNGKIIGEFVCDHIKVLRYDALYMTYMTRRAKDEALVNEEFYPGTCVSYREAFEYCHGMNFNENHSDVFYGLHISNLVMYDTPKDLSEFSTFCMGSGSAGDKRCVNCPNLLFDDDPLNGHTRWCGVNKRKPLSRPPQSWCYVNRC